MSVPSSDSIATLRPTPTQTPNRTEPQQVPFELERFAYRPR